jgi:glycosyltransferase involved in cell wall biosynthesis
MIYDKETGFLADEGDYQTWIESIKLLLNDKELAEKLGNNARELLLEKFNWDVVAKKFIVVAESVLKERN